MDQITSLFPSFLWVLRDFSLKLVDKDHHEITEK